MFGQYNSNIGVGVHPVEAEVTKQHWSLDQNSPSDVIRMHRYAVMGSKGVVDRVEVQTGHADSMNVVG